MNFLLFLIQLRFRLNSIHFRGIFVSASKWLYSRQHANPTRNKKWMRDLLKISSGSDQNNIFAPEPLFPRDNILWNIGNSWQFYCTISARKLRIKGSWILHVLLSTNLKFIKICNICISIKCLTIVYFEQVNTWKLISWLNPSQ